MSSASLIRYVRFAYISRPSHEHGLYRSIRRSRAAKIVEIGLGSAVRSRRMIEVAQRYHRGASVHYTGIDLFEARTKNNGIRLKDAFRQLTSTGAKVRLVPGDPHSGLACHANGLVGTDILVISSDIDHESMKRAWFFVPRMLHAQSLVLVERACPQQSDPKLRLLSDQEIVAAARQASRKRNLAA